MYGKTFTSLWEGSMVGQADAQLVFIFLFCHCDSEGFVEAHPAIIAAKTGIPLDRVKAALELLEGPDPQSRSKAEGGRRIMPLTGDHLSGWKVVNYDYYRKLRKEEDRREYHRNYWHKRKKSSTQLNTRSKRPQRNSTQEEGEVEEEAEKTPLSRIPFKIPTTEDVRKYCEGSGLPVDAEQFCAFYASKGWKVGNQSMKDWKAAVVTWVKRRKEENGHRPKTVTAADLNAFADHLEKGGKS